MKNFAQKFPIIFSILLFVISMPILWGAFYPLLYKLPFYFASAIKYTLTLLAVIAACFIIYRKIPFTLQCKELFKGLFSFGLVGLICAVMAFIFSYSAPDTTPSVSIVLGFTLYNLAIAYSEEFLFRGAIFTQMLDSWKDKKGFIWAAIIGSSIIFGLLTLKTRGNDVFPILGAVGGLPYCFTLCCITE